MYKKIVRWTLVGLLGLFASESVASFGAKPVLHQDSQRFALVIGNKDYEYRPLINPVKDARAIKMFLLKSQFDEKNIFYAENADLATMQKVIGAFMQRLKQAKNSIAFVYYNGHGIQEASFTGEITNYLIPVNNNKIITTRNAWDLGFGSISLNRMLRVLDERNHGLNIVLVDSSFPNFGKERSSFTPISISATGVFVAYRTRPEELASDDSSFRESFIEQASQPQKLGDVFTEVKKTFDDRGYRETPLVMDLTVRGWGSEFYFTRNTGYAEKFAFVIGNKNYEKDPLIHTIDDARRMKKFLENKGFKVTYAEDATMQIMRAKIKEFMQHITKKSVAFIYYSGHGVQEKSETQHGDLTNYLIPINNAELTTVTDLDYESISLNKLLKKLDEKNHGLNIALIDSCRTGFPSKKSGSTPIGNMPAEGVYLAYATASGVSADDNGLFSKSFIKYANKSLNLQEIFVKVKDDLKDASQRPTVIDDSLGVFSFTD